MYTKKLLAAGILRDLQFVNADAFEIYLYHLDQKMIFYEILDKFTRDDGSVIIRIVTSYNHSPIIKVYDY